MQKCEEEQVVSIFNMIIDAKHEGEKKLVVSYDLYPNVVAMTKEAGFSVRKHGKKTEITGSWFER